MSDAHAEGDGHTAVEHVTLIVGLGARFLSGVSYYTALLTSAALQPGASSTRAGTSGPETPCGGVPTVNSRDGRECPCHPP